MWGVFYIVIGGFVVVVVLVVFGLVLFELVKESGKYNGFFLRGV